MDVKHKRVLLWTVAALISLLLTNCGLMAFGFGGSGYGNGVAGILFWALPLLSLPVLGIYVFWSKMPTAVFWILLFCQWASASWLNWESYLHQGSITSNPFLYALIGAAVFAVWCWVLIAGLCQYEHNLRANVFAPKEESHC